MNKIKFIIYKWLIKKLGYSPKPDTKWQPGYIRYFNIISYPKEGWINTFHNYDNEDDLRRDLGSVFADDTWGPMLKKKSKQIVFKTKR